MDDPNITMEEYIMLEEEKARMHGKVYNWEIATYGKIWYDEDVHDLRSVETKFPSIVFNDTLMSEPTAPGVVKLEIEGNVNFEIKSQFMRELREDTFSGNKNDDAHEHVERVLDIVSLFNITEVSHDAVMLRVFPITLTGAAKRWVYRLPSGTEEVKSIVNAKYGEFGRPSPFRNGAKYRIGPPGYYIRMDNRPPVREKKAKNGRAFEQTPGGINAKKDRD
uniref:Reverse transcriptase domain-containing protein n=1 Tax=Tanacetum cinerariifolium TaxID=118510 RepID=A0A6L2J500_TANCI|nr:hypothetical protein [Tanacetum cinerariifolium]